MLDKGVFTTIDFPGAVATVVNPDVTIVTTVNGINAPGRFTGTYGDGTTIHSLRLGEGRLHPARPARLERIVAPTPVKPAGGDAFGQAARDFSGRDEGDWEERRNELGRPVVDSIARYTSNPPEAIIEMEIMGPPDIERENGLTGGHIFQGECLPHYMWDRRLEPKTPMSGVYLYGACTHPGGSVIGINGRNAAMKILSEHRYRKCSSGG